MKDKYDKQTVDGIGFVRNRIADAEDTFRRVFNAVDSLPTTDAVRADMMIVSDILAEMRKWSNLYHQGHTTAKMVGERVEELFAYYAEGPQNG